jgi:benzodiazapine receptor
MRTFQPLLAGLCFLLFNTRISAFAPCRGDIGGTVNKHHKINESPSKQLITPTAPVASSPRPSRSSLSLQALSPTATTIALAVGHVLGGCSGTPIVVRATKTWYRKIDLPKWTPPNRVFAPVWTILYASMGVAVARVIHRLPVGTVALKSPVVALWIGHYLLNLTWAPVFFGRKRFRMGLAINYALLASLCAIVPQFAANNPVSGLLLLPYAVWLLYATALNRTVCKRNPTVKGYNEAMLQADLRILQQDAARYAGL